jgi:hypothetical protein
VAVFHHQLPSALAVITDTLDHPVSNAINWVHLTFFTFERPTLFLCWHGDAMHQPTGDQQRQLRDYVWSNASIAAVALAAYITVDTSEPSWSAFQGNALSRTGTGTQYTCIPRPEVMTTERAQDFGLKLNGPVASFTNEIYTFYINDVDSKLITTVKVGGTVIALFGGIYLVAAAKASLLASAAAAAVPAASSTAPVVATSGPAAAAKAAMSAGASAAAAAAASL